MLKRYVKANKTVNLNMDKDLNRDKFLFLCKELNELRSRLESNRTKLLGDIINIRLGGFTGCDNAFITGVEKAEYLLSFNKYDGLSIPCKRPKGFQDSSSVKEYLIHIPHGFTYNVLRGCNEVGEFQEEYKELFEHFNSLDEKLKESLLGRQDHFKGITGGSYQNRNVITIIIIRRGI